MSGILGIWNSQQPFPWQQMLQDLKVLGPDGMGDWHNPDIRLSLGCAQFFDTPESCTEPPVLEAEGCVVVWDGRLDDRDSLLASRASSVTDGQLLIESYRRWGIHCIDALMGEFAFILWDTAQDILCVGCDAVGKRTVAYTWDGQTLLLASRVLTLLRHPQVSQALDPLYLANTLCSLYGQAPGSTPFIQIKRLQPGSALILKAGQLTTQKVSKFTLPERYDASRSPQSYYDQFWGLLNQSVKDRLRTVHRPCTTLSGGLDSTTVTVSLLHHLPVIDAFSTVTSIYPEFDERKPIETFLAHYPQTQWHPVNSDDAWSLSEPWEILPATDDPLVPCTLPMTLQLIEQARQKGFGLIFDGEGGDELCTISLQDLVRAGNWIKAWQHLQREGRWRSQLWWEFILPYLAPHWQRQWFARCQRKTLALPVWLTPHYVQSESVQLALQEYYRGMMLPEGLQQALTFATESGYAAASGCMNALLYSSFRLRTVSPLQDRRLIEFVLKLPPSLQSDPIYEKKFLRQVNQDHLPLQILLRHKENYFDPMKYAGIAQGSQPLELLEVLKNMPLLESIIDFNRVKETLFLYREEYVQEYCPGRPYLNGEATYLYNLFAFINWYQNVTLHLSCYASEPPVLI